MNSSVPSNQNLDPRTACQWIAELSAGWDADGSLGPKEPLSWESVARMAMDYARCALKESPDETPAASGPVMRLTFDGTRHLVYLDDVKYLPPDEAPDQLPTMLMEQATARLQRIHELEAGERILRRLLACTRPGLYGDDGELQDCAGFPFIDFKRDTPQEIDKKLFERGLAKLAEQQRTPTTDTPQS